MYHFHQITVLGRCLLFMVTTTMLTVTITLAQQPGKHDYLFIQSVHKCLSRGSDRTHHPSAVTVVNLSGAPQTLPRDCKSVFRHFLMNYKSYVSLNPPSLRSRISDVTSPDRILNFNLYAPPLDLSHVSLNFGYNKDDLSEARMTNMWGTFNNALRGTEANGHSSQPHKTKTVQDLGSSSDLVTSDGFWDGLLKRSDIVSNKVPRKPEIVPGNSRPKRYAEETLQGASSLGLASKRKGARITKGVTTQKKAYNSWYDVIRQRRQQVLSVNNALATLSDMLMEHHRNRILRNREKLRYYMMMQG